MEQIVNPEELEKLLNLKGLVRGVSFKTELDFIQKEEGRKGVEKVEEEMEKLEYPIKYEEIKPMNFYPLGVNLLQLVLIEKIFGYSQEDFQKMGRFEPKVSVIIRLFLKYFASLKKVQEEAPAMWRKYYTVGKLRVIELDEEKRCARVRLENFPGHPIYCQIFGGYFSTVLQMIVGKKVDWEEISCVQKGDDFHEFLLEW